MRANVHKRIWSYEKNVSTVIINKFTNINKANNHLSPQLIEYRKRSWHMTLEIHVIAWNMRRNVYLIGLSSQTMLYMAMS